MMLLTSIDGERLPAGSATIPAHDEGLLRGDGAFEVVRVYAGKPFALGDHLSRLQRSCEAIELDCRREAFESELAELLAEALPGDCLLRVVITRGGRRILMLEELPTYPPATTLQPVTYSPSGVLTGVKSLSYAANMEATRRAQRAGADEALLVSPAGIVLEAPTSSIFWARSGALHTPALDVGILASITRDRLVAALDVREGSFTLHDLEAADEVFLASTTREVQPVSRVGEHSYEAPGPLTRHAAELLRSAIERELGL